MKIAFSGWSRFRGHHVLVESDTAELEPSEPDYYDGNRVYIERNIDSARIDIVTKARGLREDADYCVRVELTTREIANLARIALEKEPFGNAIEALSKKITVKLKDTGGKQLSSTVGN